MRFWLTEQYLDGVRCHFCPLGIPGFLHSILHRRPAFQRVVTASGSRLASCRARRAPALAAPRALQVAHVELRKSTCRRHRPDTECLITLKFERFRHSQSDNCTNETPGSTASESSNRVSPYFNTILSAVKF